MLESVERSLSFRAQKWSQKERERWEVYPSLETEAARTSANTFDSRANLIIYAAGPQLRALDTRALRSRKHYFLRRGHRACRVYTRKTLVLHQSASMRHPSGRYLATPFTRSIFPRLKFDRGTAFSLLSSRRARE